MPSPEEMAKLIEAGNLLNTARKLLVGMPFARDLDSLLSVAQSETERLLKLAPTASGGVVPVIITGRASGKDQAKLPDSESDPQ